MSLQRTHRGDALQRIMTSFKHFENKIDKLQNDVDYHGQTLNDLRSMVNNLSQNTVYNPDGKLEEMKLLLKKNTAIQYENRAHIEKPHNICKRKKSIQPLSSKIKSKICRTEANENKTPFVTMPTNVQGMSRTRSPRPKKAEAPRKANTLRNQKNIVKKRSTLPTTK